MKKKKIKKRRLPPPKPPRVPDSQHRPHIPDSSFTQDQIDEYWDSMRRDDNYFLYGMILVLIGIGFFLVYFVIKTQ